MQRIALVNMPFASAQLPSIALAQLRTRLYQELGDDQVECDVLHLNHDCACELTPELYDLIAGSVQAVTSGLGDWFFKPVAFPEMDDDPELYLRRHFSEHRQQLEMLKGPLLEKRASATEFIDGLIDRYELTGYDVVGMTSMFSQNVACFSLARRLKERDPSVITVMGGANCETAMGRVIANNVECVDYVFSGPALVSLPRFVELLSNGERELCGDVEGVYPHAQKGGGLRLVEDRPQVGAELDIDVPIPLDYDDFLESLDEKLPAGSVKPMIMFETSRGCWWGERSHCTFCGLNGMTMKYRGMAPELAREQFQNLFDRYADRVDHFQSVDNIMPREYLTDLFPDMETPEHLEIFYEVKADLKAREMEVMAGANVTQIQPGIESINTQTLRLMRKGTTSFQNLHFLKNCLIYGIEPHWNLLVGFPDEPEEVYAKYVEDLPALMHLPPPSGAFPVRFDRFSPYFKAAQEWGLELKPCDFYGMVYPFAEEDLQQLAYFFVDSNYTAPYITHTARWLAPLRSAINRWHQRWDPTANVPPRLVFRRSVQGREVVYDSRSEPAREHELDEADLEILKALSRHSKPSRLGSRLDLSEEEIATRLERLLELGLVFQERGMYMSLVLEENEEAPAALLSQQDDTEAQFHFQG